MRRNLRRSLSCSCGPSITCVDHGSRAVSAILADRSSSSSEDFRSRVGAETHRTKQTAEVSNVPKMIIHTAGLFPLSVVYMNGHASALKSEKT